MQINFLRIWSNSAGTDLSCPQSRLQSHVTDTINWSLRSVHASLSYPPSHMKSGLTDTINWSLRSWRHYWPLGLCLLLTLGIRLWLVVRTHGFIDGDEALVGIQAQHILHGELPTYYYGQPYMGSLEAYLLALIFAVAGSST